MKLADLYAQLITALTKLRDMLLAKETNVPVSMPSEPQNSPASASQAPTSTQPALPPKILAWAKIVSQEEGANPALHNPGNLKYSTLTASWGATKGPTAEDGGYLCQFATDQAGENALCQFLILGCEDELVAFHAAAARTLAGFTKVYAGNPPQGYIDAIVNAMGGDPDVQISTFLS